MSSFVLLDINMYLVHFIRNHLNVYIKIENLFDYWFIFKFSEVRKCFFKVFHFVSYYEWKHFDVNCGTLNYDVILVTCIIRYFFIRSFRIRNKYKWSFLFLLKFGFSKYYITLPLLIHVKLSQRKLPLNIVPC